MEIPPITPRLLARLPFSGELRLEQDPLPCPTGSSSPRLILRDREEALVHLADELFDGESAPDASFPDPSPQWTRGRMCVALDNSFAVFSGRSAVRAVGTGGRLLWEFPHDCWGCGDIESGSVAVTLDGSQVWATVPSDHSAHPERDYDGDRWIVLSAADGTLLTSTVLTCTAAGSHHLVHPAGDQMGLSVGEGQDGAPAYWGRYSGGDLLSVRGLGDRCLAGISPSGHSLLTTSHYCDDIALHQLPHADRRWAVEAEDSAWDYEALFVDDDRIILSSTLRRSPGLHVLLRASDGKTLGELRYPQPPSRPPHGLGDGTWLTHGDGDWLYRWSI